MLRRLFIAAAMMVAAFGAQAQMPSMEVPIDTAVRMGRLDNGLTYYIRYNNWPENRAEFYIAQRVGSLQEDEHQRGLAHFLEHMCFNGTDHFQGNEVMRYCESLGVKFGRDLNAYTAIDQTVYNISNVPTQRQSALDSCLLILYDWANGLTLDPAEIDKERGVIHEEWRLHMGAQMRMLERALPRLYPDSKYGLRFPIGLMSVVDSFPPQALRDYYEKWYRPDNQAIIVVGDVDVDHTEAEIRRLFGPIEMPANPAPVVAEPVAPNQQPIVVVEKDKEWPYDILQIMVKRDATPDSLRSTVPYIVATYARQAAITMLNARLQELALKPETPFAQASASYSQYMMSRTADALVVAALPKEGQAEAALAAALREVKRAAQHGFTATEYARCKDDVRAQVKNMYDNRDKRTSNSFCRECVDHYLSNEAMPSIDYYYELMMQLAPALPIDIINQAFVDMAQPGGDNIVVLSLNTDKEGHAIPTEDALRQSIASAMAEQVEPYVDNVRNEPLIPHMPTPGKIVAEQANDSLGYTLLTLSNGARVAIKHTDYKADQVLMTAEGHGGSSLYGPADYANINLFDDVIGACGLGNFSCNELEKALAGKTASATMSLGQHRLTVSGSSSPADLETMMQLFHLYFTAVNKDDEAYANLLSVGELALKNKALSPEGAWRDSVTVTVNSHNPRFAPVEAADLQRVDRDRVLAIAKEQTANAAAFTFYIVGNYDADSLRPLIERYIASLPAQRNVAKGPRVDTDARGVVVNRFSRNMESPKCLGVILWPADSIAYTLDHAIQADITAQVLSMIYLKKIREDASAAYTVQAVASLSRTDDRTKCVLQAVCPMKPELADTAMAIMRTEPELMQADCDADMLAKVKEFMLKKHADDTKTNGYWMGVISERIDNGIDLHTDYAATVERQSPQTITAFVRQLVGEGNRIEVLMLPE